MSRTWRAVPLLLLLAGCGHLARKLNIAYMAVATELLPDDVRVTLQRDFLETYKHRVTIVANFTVDAVSGSPNPRLFDGDLHFAGRAPEIGLRLVAELANAGQHDAAVALIKQAQARRGTLRLTGAWRLWPEHTIASRQQQGRPVAPLTNANPDHIFEIHPVLRIGGMDLRASIHTVEDYKPGNASRTFGIFEKAECTVGVTPETISITAPNGLYNDVHFIMQRSAEPPVVMEDGRSLTASALTLDGELLVERVKLVVIEGTPPETALGRLRSGERRHVWGLPRIDLAEVSRRAAESARNPAVLKGKLPYELVILGVYAAPQ